MSLAEHIFVNKQFLDDLNSFCEIKLFKAILSTWGYLPDETLDKITSMEYLVNSVLKLENSEDINPIILDTIIEDDLASFIVPEISINNYYSIVLFYDKFSSSGSPENNIPAIVMYTQSNSDTTVLPLVSFAENRIYIDLRSIPLKARINNFMSPYEQPVEGEENAQHAPAFHQHITKEINPSDSSDYNQNSCLTDMEILNRIVLYSTSTYCDYITSNVISQASAARAIGKNGDFLEDYIPADKNIQDFYQNIVGCAYEWANSRLCTEDLIDGWPIKGIKDMSLINAVYFPSNLWECDGTYSFTSWDSAAFPYLENVASYQNLSLRFIDENQESTIFVCTGVEDLTTNKNYAFSLPEEGVYNYMKLNVALLPQYQNARLLFEINQNFRTNYPISSTFASKYFDATTYQLKSGCSISVLITT